MRFVVRRLAAVLLEFLVALQAAHSLQTSVASGYKQHAGAVCLAPYAPASVMDSASIPDSQITIKKPTKNGELSYCVGGGGGN